MKTTALLPVEAATIRGTRVLGVLSRLLRDPLALYGEASALGEIVRLRLPLGDAYLVSSPALVQDVLQGRAKLFQRPPILRRILVSLGGDNLMTREGEAWLSRRRLMQPSVQRSAVAALSEAILDAIDASLDTWRDSGAEPVCMRDLLVALTREVVARTLLGVSLLQFPELGRAFTTITDYIAFRAQTPLAPPLWLPTGRNRRVRAALAYVDALTLKLLRERRAHEPQRSDLLSNLLGARDPETDEALDEAQLCHEVQMLLGAGETTTSEALTFCFSLLGTHPETLLALVHETRTLLGTRRAALADLTRLPLLRQTLDETLRLYPPSYVLGRAPTEATELGGVFLRKGTTVLVSPFAVHRDPHLWASPLAFRPERFAPGGEAERVPRHAYLPFGAGPRRCLAENLAQVEMMFAVSRILQRFELELPAEPMPRLAAGFALGLAEGLPVRLKRRL